MLKQLSLSLVLASALMPACTSDSSSTSSTRGEAAKAIGEGWCERLVDCGLMAQEDVDKCVAHNVFHMCEIDESCDLEFESEALEGCLMSMQDPDADACALAAWGVGPEECIPFWDDWDAEK